MLMREETILLICAIALAPIVLIVGFSLFWCFVVWLISAMGGWARLAERYRATRPASGHQWWNQYGFVNRARYGNALNITTNESGLFLEVMPLFRVNHAPLFIPWSDLHDPAPTTFRRWDFIRVEVGHPTVATLTLPPAIFEESEGIRVLEQARIGTNVPTSSS
jgi:hypothetical protein